MGGTAKKIGNVAKYAVPVQYIANRAATSLFNKKNPAKDLIKDYTFKGSEADDRGITGPFMLDQEQFDADKEAINTEGQKQYDESLAGIKDYGTSSNQRAKELFGFMLPDIAENAQAAHLYDSTGYGQEVAREQAKIASDIALDEAGKRYSALGGRQNFQTSALQRGLSLEDFINQANVAKTIGAQMAPQPASGKSSALSGGVAGAGAGAPFGPWGAAIGGAGGLLMGSQANKKGGK